MMGWNDEFVKTGSSCKRDCKDRKLGCRETCIAFIIYEVDRMLRAKERARKMETSEKWYFRERYIKKKIQEAREKKQNRRGGRQ